MTSAVYGAAGQFAALAVYASSHNMRGRVGLLAALAPYGPPPSRYADTGMIVGLVPWARNDNIRARVGQMASLIVWGSAILVDARQRSWAFVLDGHWFYVLDLGAQGTFCYDITTKQWCEFQTESHVGWNMRNGIAWDVTARPIGADSNYPFVWELVPENTLDEGFREIDHVVTGGVPSRSRTFHSVSALRVAASAGYVYGNANNVPGDIYFDLQFSDDNGNTWNTSPEPLLLAEGNFSQDLQWRSLGAFMAPGRIFQISDSGGLTRIDGADIFIDGFDEDAEQPPPQEQGNG